MDIKFCPRCGADRHSGDEFCRSCGRGFEDEAAEIQRRAGVVLPVPPPPRSSSAPALTQPMPVQAPAGYVPVPGAQPAVPGAGAPTAPPPTSVGAPPPAREVQGARIPVRPLALVGAGAIVVGVFLPWFSGTFEGRGNAFDVPLSFLWSLTADSGDAKLGVVLLLIGGAAAVLSFLRGTGPIRRILGIAAIVTTAAFSVQLYRAIDQLGGGPGDLFDMIGPAVYVTFVGGGLLVASR